MKKTKLFIMLIFLLGIFFAGTVATEATEATEATYFAPVFYEHGYYNQGSKKDRLTGNRLEITCSEFNLDNGKWHDAVSSVKVPSGWTVVLYEHTYYNGRSLELTSDAPNLNKYHFNDFATSVKIYYKGVLQDDCVWRNSFYLSLIHI